MPGAPGLVVGFTNVVLCTHGGKATPVPPAGRVMASGFGVVTLSHVYAITGCGFITPCVAGIVAQGTVRVRTMGVPMAVIPDSMPNSAGLPNGTPLIFAPAGQARVRAA